jgi:signal transduction histidine kinase
MISRLEAGNSAEATTKVDLAEAVRDVVDLYEPLAEEAAVGLAVVDAAPQVIAGNRELIGQALANVVDNAIKYSAVAASPQVSLRLARAGDEIVLAVRDNGPGIPEADRERVTERFVRLEGSRSMPGSGLGLSLAKAVMSYHGGRLEIADAAPGLEVRMVFPAGGRRN